MQPPPELRLKKKKIKTKWTCLCCCVEKYVRLKTDIWLSNLGWRTFIVHPCNRWKYRGRTEGCSWSASDKSLSKGGNNSGETGFLCMRSSLHLSNQLRCRHLAHSATVAWYTLMWGWDVCYVWVTKEEQRQVNGDSFFPPADMWKGLKTFIQSDIFVHWHESPPAAH